MDKAEIAELATIVIEVREVKPFKRRRLKVLARERRDLPDAWARTGLITAHHGYAIFASGLQVSRLTDVSGASRTARPHRCEGNRDPETEG